MIIGSRKCRSGEEQTPEGTCRKCPISFYLIQPPDRTKGCKQCDVNANCYGENILSPKPGYFRMSNITEDFYECANPLACAGGNEFEQTGLCALGYRGFLCNTCDSGYSKNRWDTCLACPLLNTSMILGIFQLAWTTFIILGMCNLVNVIATTDNKNIPPFVGLFKGLINHCVIFAAIGKIKCNWSEKLRPILLA